MINTSGAELPSVTQNGYTAQRVNKETIGKWMTALTAYKAGKAALENRITSAEQWWKLRNTEQENGKGIDGYKSQSAWLHNVITSKHADAMDSYPKPVILAREPGDQEQAKILEQILPCVLEQNYFSETYSDAVWQKLKFGTGVYKIVWDNTKLNGLGDISITRSNILNLFWEPGATDIQKSRYFFHTELWDRELLIEQYPELQNKLLDSAFRASKFKSDENTSDYDKVTVIEVYYHARGKLHYCKFVGDNILFASENEPSMAERGFYDHGKYPFVFDVLFPLEDTAAGYGFTDLCKNAQTEIDILKTAIVHNAMAGSVPRVFIRSDGSINEEEFLDLKRPVVHVNGNLGEDSIRPIPHSSLEGNYISVLEQTITELRHTSGNTEAATGSSATGATAASAVAALQEAAGKGSRDSTQASYRAFRKLMEMAVELIRQFYDVPRQFRILGEQAKVEYVSFSNAGIRPVYQGTEFGMDMGYRLPTFDIKMEVEKKDRYSTMAQNELAIQLYNLGAYDPMRADQTMVMLNMMSFEGKDELIRKISANMTLEKKNQLLIQYAATLAKKHGDLIAMQQLANISGAMQSQPTEPVQGNVGMPDTEVKENPIVERAREQSNTASQPRS